MARFPRGDLDTAGLNESWQPKLWALLLALLLLLSYVIAFVVKNDDSVGIDFVFASTTASLIWLIVVSLAIGVLAGVLLSQLYRRRLRG